MTALLYLLGAVAGCAAPLWCRVRGHGRYRLINEGAAVQCVDCGDWWPLKLERPGTESFEAYLQQRIIEQVVTGDGSQ